MPAAWSRSSTRAGTRRCTFGPGIHPGAHVAQGQLLGRVGMTGAATGPHLDYRIKRNGIHVNPTLEHSRMPPGEPIAAETMPAFTHERDRVFGSLDQLLATKTPGPTKQD